MPIKEKIGEDVTATIADDLGSLITLNTQVRDELEKKSEEITRLQNTNNKLVSANGALLMQVPQVKKEEPKAEESKPAYYDYHSAFDENGNII